MCDKAPESEDKSAPTGSELADRIKALTSERSIDTAPERKQTHLLDAEEPVTTRIRRRATLPSVPGETTTPDGR